MVKTNTFNGVPCLQLLYEIPKRMSQMIRQFNYDEFVNLMKFGLQFLGSELEKRQKNFRFQVIYNDGKTVSYGAGTFGVPKRFLGESGSKDPLFVSRIFTGGKLITQ